jgi:hypothetical protein
MAGFGAYIALSVVLHAIFTTMLGITLPFAMYTGASSMLAMLTGPVGIGLAIAAGLVGYSFGHKKLNRSQYAMVVWACVARYGRRLYTPNELLPSARTWNLLPAGTDSGLSVARTTATNSTALVWPRPGACELEAVRSQADESDQELSTRDSERKVATLTNLAATEDVRSTAKELARLKSKLASAETELTATRQRAADTTTALNQRNTAIACLEAEISRLSLEGTASAERVRNAESRAQATQDRLRAAEEKYELKLEGRRSEIEKLWAVHFPRFSFGSKALRWVADKTFRERLEVERALIELRDASDPASISRGKMNGSDQHHSAFSLAPDTPARIYYRIKGGKVQITQILKKNEQKQFDASA